MKMAKTKNHSEDKELGLSTFWKTVLIVGEEQPSFWRREAEWARKWISSESVLLVPWCKKRRCVLKMWMTDWRWVSRKVLANLLSVEEWRWVRCRGQRHHEWAHGWRTDVRGLGAGGNAQAVELRVWFFLCNLRWPQNLLTKTRSITLFEE